MSMELDKLAGQFVQALAPDDDVRLLQRARRVIREDGRVEPAAMPILWPWQSRDFVMPSAAVLGQRSVATYQIPNGGTIRRIAARCHTAPVGGPVEFSITINGEPGPRIAIQAGQFTTDSNDDTELPPMCDVWLVTTMANGATNCTVTIHYEPTGDVR